MMELSKTAEIFLPTAIEALEFKGSFPEVFKNKNYISLRTIIKNVGSIETTDIVYKIMARIIRDAIEIDTDNVKHLIDNIIENYPDVSLEDIVYFAKRLIRGEFIGKQIGESKESLVTIKVFKYDVPTLCLMWQRHYSERLDAWETLKANQSEEEKKATIHPDVLELFANVIDNNMHRGIYKDLKHYCEVNEMKETIFVDAYTKLYDQKLAANTLDEISVATKKLHHDSKGINLDDLKDEDIEKVFLSMDQFIQNKIAQFLVIQNQIQTSANINNTYTFTMIVDLCNDYDIPKLVEMCKSLGMWMIPTKFYFAAKKIMMEGGEIKFRYDINKGNIEVINKFIQKVIEDQKISNTELLFIMSMVFNFTLNLGRFIKYNGEHKTDDNGND